MTTGAAAAESRSIARPMAGSTPSRPPMPTNQPNTTRRGSDHDTAAPPHSGSVAASARWNGSTNRARRSWSGTIPTGEHATIPATGRSAAHATASGAPNECPITTGRSAPTRATASAIRRAAAGNVNGSSMSDPPCPGRSTATTRCVRPSRSANGSR